MNLRIENLEAGLPDKKYCGASAWKFLMAKSML